MSDKGTYDFDHHSEGETLNVKLADVPAYLQIGELFQNLKQNEGTNVDEHEAIVVPKNCLKQTVSVQQSHELLFLLRSLRYWAVEGLPDSVYAYLTSQHSTPFEEMWCIRKDYPEVKLMPILRIEQTAYHLATAASHGDLPLMTYLHEKAGIQWQHTECTAAAINGQLACLQYAHEHGCNLKGEGYRSKCACMQAFCNGHAECLQYAHGNGCELLQRLDTFVCEHTSVACLLYILNRPDAFQKVAARSLRSIGNAAIRLGSISCVDKIRAMGWRMTENSNIFRTALLADDTSIVEYVINEGCVLTGQEANTLVELGRTDNLMLLLDRGQRLAIRSVRELGNMQEFSVLREVIERQACTAIAAAATIADVDSSQLDILIRAFAQGFENSAELCNFAVAEGNQALLQRAVEDGCLFNEKVCATAARGGHLSCLRYLVEHGAVITMEVGRSAVRGGHLICLRYLHEERDHELTTPLIMAAIKSDNVPFVRYLHDHDCRIDTTQGARRAARAGALQCFVHYHGLAGPRATKALVWRTVWEAARISRNSAIREYARRKIKG
jgi:hypothetical protein